MGRLLGLREHLQSGDKFWLTLWIIGVAFAITILTWAALKIRSLFLDDEGPAGDVGEFLGRLQDSQLEGDVTPEEFRSIQSRLLEPSIRSGDNSQTLRVTPAKSADPQQPPPSVPYQDDADDQSP